MIAAVIVEDEPATKLSLIDDLKEYCPQIKIIGDAATVKTAVDTIIKLQPQLLFLDINLPDGTGFDVLKQLETKQGGVQKLAFQVIFTTASDKYAIEAIKFSALDYLLKPVDPDELIIAVNKVKPNESQTSAMLGMQTLLETNIHADQSKKIVLKGADSISVYAISDIIRCESQRNYTQFFFKADKPLLVSTTLGEFDTLLGNYGFMRVHHSHLINLNHLKKFVKSEGGHIVMADGSEVPVAQRKKDQLLKLLSSL